MHIRVLVPADLAFSSAIRDIAKETATRVDFNDKQKNMLKLVIDELFMNAIRYGSDNKSSVFVEIIEQENSLICAIEDEGKGEKKITAVDLKEIIKKGKENTSLKKLHGRGLAQITSELVEAYEVLDKPGGGLRIEFFMKRKTEVEEEQKIFNQQKKERLILPEKMIYIKGSIDLNNIDEISKQVDDVIEEYYKESFRLILEFSELEYCNSTFLGKIAEWQSALEINNGECEIRNPSKNIFEILDLVGLTNILNIKYENETKS